jgi:valacyclovir hydrolase
MPWFEDGASRIYYEESGAGEPVLLLPGFSDRIEGHAALRRALNPDNRVIAADLPGSGRSGPQPREYTASYLADDARSFATLLRCLGTGPTHLVGFSDGARSPC